MDSSFRWKDDGMEHSDWRVQILFRRSEAGWKPAPTPFVILAFARIHAAQISGHPFVVSPVEPPLGMDSVSLKQELDLCTSFEDLRTNDFLGPNHGPPFVVSRSNCIKLRLHELRHDLFGE